MYNSQIFLSHLWELGKREYSDLVDRDFEEMTAILIREMPIRFLPKLEDYDQKREVMAMLGEWMQTEDDFLGHQILERMKELAIKAMHPICQDEMRHYAKREQQAIDETRTSLEQHIAADNRQR